MIKLADGRRLAWAEYGDPAGKPVFLFHGAPGSRLQRHPDESILYDLGVRLIAPDRPGYGRSDWKPNRTLVDWPDDVAQLADALGIDRFAALGPSGGGPHAAACAWRLPERVTAAALVSCPVSFDVPGMLESLPKEQRTQMAVAGKAPWLVRLLFWWYAKSAPSTPEKVLEKLAHDLPEADLATVRQPGFAEMFLEDNQEAMRSGARGCAHELQLLTRPWGFPLQEIRVPVYLWQGERDTSVSAAMGQYLAKSIPNSQFTFCPGEGHLVGLTHWREILTALIAH